jgi:hypothetical protein
MTSPVIFVSNGKSEMVKSADLCSVAVNGDKPSEKFYEEQHLSPFNGLERHSLHKDHEISITDDNVLRQDESKSLHEQRVQAITKCYENILNSIGEDVSRDGTVMFFVFH